MTERLLVFQSSTLCAPPLAIWQPTLKGWSHSQEIISSALFEQTQLYLIDSLRPLHAFETNNATLLSVARYFCLVAALFHPSLAPSAVATSGSQGVKATIELAQRLDRTQAFQWRLLSDGKNDFAEKTYIFHTAAAEMSLAAYNLAVALVQSCVLLSTRLSADKNALKVSIQMMAAAEHIFLVLEHEGKFAPSLMVTPAAPQDAIHLRASTLKLWADVCHAQLAELWLTAYLEQGRLKDCIGTCVSLAQTYAVLYATLENYPATELLSVGAGFLKRLVAIKRRYYRVKAYLFVLDQGNISNEEVHKRAAQEAIELMRKSIASSEKILPHIVGVLTAELDEFVEYYELATVVALDERTAETTWTNIEYNYTPLPPRNSVRVSNPLVPLPLDLGGLIQRFAGLDLTNPEARSLPSPRERKEGRDAQQSTGEETASNTSTGLCFNIFLALQSGLWSTRNSALLEQRLREWWDSLNLLLPQFLLFSITRERTPMYLLDQPIRPANPERKQRPVPPEFTGLATLHERLSRLGMAMREATIASDWVLQYETQREDAAVSQLRPLVQILHEQVRDYIAAIVLFFSRTQPPDGTLSQSLTRLAGTIVTPPPYPPGTLDPTLLAQFRPDMETVAEMAPITEIEKIIRSEINNIRLLLPSSPPQ